MPTRSKLIHHRTGRAACMASLYIAGAWDLCCTGVRYCLRTRLAEHYINSKVNKEKQTEKLKRNTRHTSGYCVTRGKRRQPRRGHVRWKQNKCETKGGSKEISGFCQQNIQKNSVRKQQSQTIKQYSSEATYYPFHLTFDRPLGRY